MTCWVVDTEHVVHRPPCTAADARFVPYACTALDIHAWLARPDVRDGHAGSAMIRACPICIPEVADDADL